MTHKAYKYRIYPTKEQQQFLSNQFGAVRFVYNYFLNNRKEEYLNNKKSLSYFDDAKHLTELKQQDGYDWLYNINAQTLQSSLRNLEVAYNNFFKKQSRFPKFHSKKNKQSIKIPQKFKIKDNKLYIPKLKGGIEINLHRELIGKTICCYISKTPSGKYYVSFLCETDIKPLPKLDNIIGIDLGIKTLVTTSNGNKIENPKFHKKLEKKLIFQQRQLSKKKKGSKIKNKQRIIVAKIHEKITNRRIDNLHKISKKLVDENQIIIVEDLSVKNMLKNHNLAKEISNVSWAELLRQLEYKSEWYGRTFYKIDRFFPSSKMCNNCQYIVDDLPLNIREWNCPSCSKVNDRDINAALNIKDKGIKDLKMSVSGIESDNKQKLPEALAKPGR